jgi:hypothetical protein
LFQNLLCTLIHTWLAATVRLAEVVVVVIAFLFVIAETLDQVEQFLEIIGS